MSHWSAQFWYDKLQWVYTQHSKLKKEEEGKHTPLAQEWIDKLTELNFVWCLVLGCSRINMKPAAGGSTPVSLSVATAGSVGHIDISTETKKDNLDPRLTLSQNMPQDASLESTHSSHAAAVTPGFSKCKQSNSREEWWAEQFEELVIYKKQHGHCHVPFSLPILSRWVSCQHWQYQQLQRGKSSRLTNACLEWSESIGFVCDNKSLCGNVTAEPKPGSRKADNTSETDKHNHDPKVTLSLSYKESEKPCPNIEVDGGPRSRNCDIESYILTT